MDLKGCHVTPIAKHENAQEGQSVMEISKDDGESFLLFAKDDQEMFKWFLAFQAPSANLDLD